MSLDFSIFAQVESEVFDGNITHNLSKMALEAELYAVLWIPHQVGIQTCGDAIPWLKAGIKKLVQNPEKFRNLNPPNGWGTYEGLLEFAKKVLSTCESYPEGRIKVSR